MILALPAVFFSAHADDDTLQFGLDIMRHLAAGRPVHVVLFSLGFTSGAKDKINGLTGSTWWGGTHNPHLEGYHVLSNEEFGQARQNEFRTACGLLGVQPENLYFHVLDDQGQTFDKEAAKTIMRTYINMLPAGTSFKTHSPFDSAPDHVVLAEALHELWQAGEAPDARFFLARNDRTKTGLPASSTITATAAETAKLTKACKAYQAWNPATGSFAIGYHSVADQFENLQSSPTFKYFKPEVL